MRAAVLILVSVTAVLGLAGCGSSGESSSSAESMASTVGAGAIKDTPPKAKNTPGKGGGKITQQDTSTPP